MSESNNEKLPILNLTYEGIMEAFSSYVAEEQPVLESPDEVAKTMLPLVTDCEQEEFWALCLDAKHHLITAERVTRGLADRSQIHAREVFRDAIRRNATRMILVHPHPSGDPTPSRQDITCTKNLVKAGEIIGIDVLDHIVIGKRTPSRDKPWVSFREEHLLSS